MLDTTSLEILKILQEKARIPNIEVSRQVGLAPSAVLERIRKMEKQGIIDGYEVRLNPQRFQRPLLAFIHVKTMAGAGAQVADQLAALAEVQEVHFVTGKDCYLVKVRTTDNPSLCRLLQEQIAAISGVLSTETETVLSTIKETSRIPLPATL
jgi:Lrp/AsnC family transcriptional regulator, leucine-responsive regulatory protein